MKAHYWKGSLTLSKLKKKNKYENAQFFEIVSQMIPILSKK